MIIKRATLFLCLALCLGSCTYMKYASVQAEYARIQNAEPGQLVVKHMIDRESYFVNGRCIDNAGSYSGVPKAIAAAAKGEEHGLIVLPSWRDLNPENGFIGNLYRNPLPDFLHHELIYAYQNPGTIKLGENSDGVVALTSQLHPQAQTQASGQFGFDNTHTDILDSEQVTAHIRARMDIVENPVPPPQLQVLNQGGYDIKLGDAYSPRAQYVIHNVGIYLMALTEGTFEPFYDDEEKFMAAVKGEKSPRNDIEKGWLRFLSEYPEFRTASP